MKEGLSEYLRRKNRNLKKMIEYAGICRVKPLLEETWLNAMIKFPVVIIPLLIVMLPLSVVFPITVE